MKYKNTDITIRKSKRARHLKLQMSMEDGFVLVVPPLTPKLLINHFLKQNEGWIEKQKKKLEEHQKKHPLPTYHSGDTFYYLGEPVKLIVRPTELKRASVRIRGDQMIIRLNAGVSDAEGKRQIKKNRTGFLSKKGGGSDSRPFGLF